jgi:hypothetical protein
MAPLGKQSVKNILGSIPFTAELYWLVRQKGKPIESRFSLKHLQANLPEIAAQAAELKKTARPGKRILIFATLHYWIEHASLLGMALSAMGHKVTIGFLPYSDWQSEINRFDLRRQNVYARKVLSLASPVMESVSFLESSVNYKPLPEDLARIVDLVTAYDTQYTLQVEEVQPDMPVYKLRRERNTEVVRTAMQYFKSNRPDLVIVPNGTIQELGVVYRLARFLKIPAVTYEFGDQRQRIWVAQNDEVMRQNTDGLWKARQGDALTEGELERLKSLFAARQSGAIWENFARRWQDSPAEGGQKARETLGLDQRPLVLLATNVLGDSLTLGRQVFSQTMAQWIARTVQYFAGRPEVQLVVRIHPGEVLTHGQSMVEVVRQVLPRLPEHIHLIGPKDKMNTYDLMEAADLGLVYTTTVGLEMSMIGLPVVVSGLTHYRGRGFTHDPDSWVTYYKTLGQMLDNPAKYRLTRQQTEAAWQYAYRFFFDFPRPFPWHLVRVWEDYKARPLKNVFDADGLALYGQTFGFLSGEPLDWSKINHE